MLVLFNLRWAGTPEEFQEYMGRVKSLCEEIEGITFLGVFIPQTEWDYTIVVEAESLDLDMEFNRRFLQKYGWPPFTSTAWTYLHTFEDFGLPSPV